jgi:double-strand break repair protein MRE11
LCGLDLLSVAGLVNYFGKQSKIDDMIVKPVLFQKNENKLALYGIGNVRDERLHRTFKQKKCRFERPSENPDDWFNLFVIHQNRTAHSSTNYIPSDYIDNFFHLVLWGHEHECLIDPDQVSEDSFYITQPGSSVATSLCEGEAKAKHVAILTINGQDFEFEKVRLKTIRPFIIDSIILGAVPNLNPSDSKAVKNYLHTKVLEMIETVKSDWLRHNTGDMPKPLVRLKVEYTGGYGTFNPQQFGQNYVDLVANPADILLFYRKKKYAGKGKKSQPNIDVDFEFIPDKLNDKNLQDFITEILCHNELQLLPENEFGSSIQAFVEKQEPNAIADFVNNTKTQAEKTIQSKDTVDYENVERLRDQVVIIKQERAERFASAMALDETKAKKAKTTVVAREASVDEERVYESPDNNYYNEPQSENVTIFNIG